jgi:hypothetical protein
MRDHPCFNATFVVASHEEFDCICRISTIYIVGMNSFKSDNVRFEVCASMHHQNIGIIVLYIGINSFNYDKVRFENYVVTCHQIKLNSGTTVLNDSFFE